MQVKKHEAVWAPRQHVAYWMNRASRLMLRLHDGRLKAHGLSMGQMPVLDALMDGGSRSQKEIAAHAGVKQPTMAELLARMERDGVVERTPDPEDGRGSRISLTAWAKKRLAPARATLVAGAEQAVAGFGAAEIATLRGLLERVVANLEAAEAAEAPARSRSRSRPR